MSLMWVAVPQVFVPALIAFPGVLAGGRIETTETQTSTDEMLGSQELLNPQQDTSLLGISP